eukprot:scaffold11731_cov119-Isochrysis_galbana.AAC.6
MSPQRNNHHLFTLLSPAPPRYLGMDVDADADLLWIADEALQATEPYGWEERLDPAGGRYFHNTITQMTIVQHPVDYHYQQLYLQMKRESAARNRRGACAELPAPSPMGRTPSYVLDLRSVSADDTGGSSPSTPKGWLNRAKTLVTPRGRPAKPVETVRFTVNIRRAPSERLGVELDGRNQIIAILAGSPCARCQDIHVQDRIVTVDGQASHTCHTHPRAAAPADSRRPEKWGGSAAPALVAAARRWGCDSLACGSVSALLSEPLEPLHPASTTAPPACATLLFHRATLPDARCPMHAA